MSCDAAVSVITTSDPGITAACDYAVFRRASEVMIESNAYLFISEEC